VITRDPGTFASREGNILPSRFVALQMHQHRLQSAGAVCRVYYNKQQSKLRVAYKE